mmetsp:Transcript_982/g.2384  ORF Transcript_982/g.2384 Transcript_982/m.2384 type:complete len:211 (-) Transcript_982:666-1298(-)
MHELELCCIPKLVVRLSSLELLACVHVRSRVARVQLQRLASPVVLLTAQLVVVFGRVEDKVVRQLAPHHHLLDEAVSRLLGNLLTNLANRKRRALRTDVSVAKPRGQPGERFRRGRVVALLVQAQAVREKVVEYSLGGNLARLRPCELRDGGASLARARDCRVPVDGIRTHGGRRQVCRRLFRAGKLGEQFREQAVDLRAQRARSHLHLV